MPIESMRFVALCAYKYFFVIHRRLRSASAGSFASYLALDVRLDEFTESRAGANSFCERARPLETV